jgi:hypothetical protein
MNYYVQQISTQIKLVRQFFYSYAFKKKEAAAFCVEEQLLNALNDTSWMSTWDITSHTYQALPFTLIQFSSLKIYGYMYIL